MKIIIVDKCTDKEKKKTGYKAFVFRGKGNVHFAKTEKDALRILLESFCDKCKFIDTDCTCG